MECLRTLFGPEQANVIYSKTSLKYEAMKNEIAKFFSDDIAFVEEILELPSETVNTSVNHTLFEHADGTYTLNPHGVPYESFLQNLQYSKLELDKSGIDTSDITLVVKEKFFEQYPLLANSLQQLMLWVSTAADLLSDQNIDVSFILDCCHGVELCQRMSEPNFSEEYGLVPKFDVIHSSDLMDHTSPPSLVLSAAQLLKQNAFLFTTVLLYRFIGPNANKYLKALFGFDPELLPVICGLRCMGYEGEYSDPVSLQPVPLDKNHELINFGIGVVKRLVWQRLNGSPFLFALADSSSAYAKALCSAALLRSKFGCSPGNTTLRYLSTETTVFIFRCFASLFCFETSVQFWEGVANLIQRDASLKSYLLHLQTQAQLHGLHIHFDREHCSFCNPSSTIGQFSISVNTSSLKSESVFKVAIHKEEALDESKEHHIVDSVSGKVIDEVLSLDFFFPDAFAKESYYVTLFQQCVTQHHHARSDTVKVLSGKLLDFSSSARVYKFQPVTPLTPPTQFIVKEHKGDADRFETTLLLNNAPAEISCSMITTSQTTSSNLTILCGRQSLSIDYPYPIQYDTAHLKFSSKKNMIKITVCRKKHKFNDEDVLPFKANLGHKFSFPTIKMDLKLYGFSYLYRMQFTKQEISLLKCESIDSPKLTPEIHLRLFLMSMLFNDDKRILDLVGNRGAFGYIYIHSHVADVENKLPAVDLSFYFPESFDSTFCEKWKIMLSLDEGSKFGSAIVPLDHACTLLKSVLQYYARRTTTKSYHSKSFLSIFGLEKYFTRAMVYLPYRDPDAIVADEYQWSNSARHSGATNAATSSQVPIAPVAKATLPMPTIPKHNPDLHVQNKQVSCASCGKMSQELRKCTSCKTVSYCNKNCQRKDWSKHKHVCKKK